MVYIGPKEVHETQSFTITCHSSLFANFKWRGPIIDLENDRRTSIRSHNEVERKISILTISSASAEYSGNYKCSYDHDDYGFNVTVIVGKEGCVSVCIISALF